MNATELASALNAKKSGDGWIAKCVAHDDKHPSMSISEVDGKVLVKCHASCEQSDVIGELQKRGLWNGADRNAAFTSHLQLGQPSALYDYQDATGQLIGRVMRFDRQGGKEIRQCSLQGDAWTWKAMPAPRPLYRLPSILKTANTVLMVEGEKAVAAAAQIMTDMTVTTWAGGAKATDKADYSCLNGRNVILWPDNDQPGRDAMQSIANRLHGVAASVRMFDPSALGDLPDGWDAADALADKSVDLDAIWQALLSAPAVHSVAPVPVQREQNTATTSRGSDYQLVAACDLLSACAPLEYIVDGLLEDGIAAGIVGPPESGKSLIAINVAACVATGKEFHGRTVKQGLVVYLAGEGHSGIRRRLQAIEHRYGYGLATAPLMVSKAPASFLDPVEVLRVRDAIEAAKQKFQQPLRLLVVDTVIRYLAPGDDNKSQDMAAYLAAVDVLRGDATSLSCHHPGHADATRARGSSNWRAGLDAEYSIANAAEIITVTCQKMKDGDRPEPFSFRIEQAPTLSAREDGSPVMSVVIAPTDAVVTIAKPTGKNQKLLLAELERRDTGGMVWTEKDLREIGRAIGMHKNSARDAVLGLRQLHYLTETIGGSRLTHGTESTKPDRKCISVPDERTENAPVSIDTVLSVRPSVPDSSNGAIHP